MKLLDPRSCDFQALPIPGGGYVTGILYHPVSRDVLYLRTDIGGVYRYEAGEDRFQSLIGPVSQTDVRETYPISIALDPEDSNVLYVMSGVNNPEVPGLFQISRDQGENFERIDVPFYVHGNLNGRGSGERLLVDERCPSHLLFASQKDGLWSSGDGGRHWEKNLQVAEQSLTMLRQVGNLILLGTAGISTMEQREGKAPVRGHSLYLSADGGRSFAPIPQPESLDIPEVTPLGPVAQHAAADVRYVYVTFSVTGRYSYVKEYGYGCDSGDSCDGRILRYEIRKDGLGSPIDITPEKAGFGPCGADYGFSGIDTAGNMPGLVVCSTVTRDDGDCIYRSTDYGETWTCVLHGLDTGVMKFRTSYMSPEYNGGGNLIHWLSDLKLDPLRPQRAWFTTGTGVFRTENMLDETVTFSDRCDGIEETVHLNVYSLPEGPVRVLDIVGDLGGFAFTDVMKPCRNSFADPEGNRYITCINADFADTAPEKVVVTARGNWTGKTKGGLILSEDYGQSFGRLSMPYGLSAEIDAASRGIETPNTNAGWAAMSSDGSTILWTLARGIELPGNLLVRTADDGRSYTQPRLIPHEHAENTRIKIFSDRVLPHVFYGFGDAGQLWISTDSGESFTEQRRVLPELNLALIDTANKFQIRAVPGEAGTLLLSLGKEGLWKVLFNPESGEVSANRLTEPGVSVYRFGIGMGRMIYCNAEVNGVYGFYRTADEGQTMQRIGDDRHLFGDINAMEADRREAGRFYLATGSCGLIGGCVRKTESL